MASWIFRHTYGSRTHYSCEAPRLGFAVIELIAIYGKQPPGNSSERGGRVAVEMPWHLTLALLSRGRAILAALFRMSDSYH